MRGALIGLVIQLTMSSVAYGQDVANHEATTTPPNARYEIVQSPRVARLTMRLDRWSGIVDMLVVDNVGRYAWESMPVVGLIAQTNATNPRFQIFTSGRVARNTFLLDTVTGRSWSFVTVTFKGRDGQDHERDEWQPFEP